MKTADKYQRARVETTLKKLGVESFTGETVSAYINHDRWVADCPCKGAELVTPGYVMLCGSCGAEHKVKFPGPKSRSEIERLLTARPDPYTRNWTGELVDELLAENIERGVW